MALTKDQLEQLAHLSRLALTDEQTARIGADLEKMMAMAEHVQEVDTSSFDGVAHVHADDQPLREDAPEAAPGDLAEGAAENRDGHVVVPKVLP